MNNTLKFLGSGLGLRPFDEFDEFNKNTKNEKAINLMALSQLGSAQVSFGRPNKETGEAMVKYIKKAIHLALDNEIEE